MPEYEIVVVKHGSQEPIGRYQIPAKNKDEVRTVLGDYVGELFPYHKAKRSGPDAYIVMDGKNVIATVAVEVYDGERT